MVEKKKKTRSTSSSADPATQYAMDVTSGRVPAGPDIRNACARHLRDLEKGPARGLFWDVDAVTGANQIPDMSSFASVRGVTGSQRLPGGRIRQWQQVTVATGGTCTFPTAFPTALENFSVIHGPGATGPIIASVATANRSGLQILHNGTTNIFTVISEGY